MTGNAAFDASYFIGPFGGIVAIAFGAGAAAGWAFASQTVLKLVTKEREECERRIGLLEARVRELEERYIGGLERQLGQIRQSSVSVLRKGEE